MPPKYIALDTGEVRRLRSGACDANGQHPKPALSDGNGYPWRHWLREIAHCASTLILAHRPFRALHAYAGPGPIFHCAQDCKRHPQSSAVPYLDRQTLVRAYDHHEHIVYGSGQGSDMARIEIETNYLFNNNDLSFIHARSPANNCFHFRIEA